MHYVLLLIDFVGFDAVLVSQSEDAILSRSNVGAAKVDPLGLFVLGAEKITEKTIEN